MKKNKKAALLSAKNKNLLLIVKFLILLNVFAIPLYAILISGAQWDGLKAFTADSIYSMVQASGMNPERSDLTISIPIKNGSWAANIDWDCTAWKSMFAFFALVMSAGFAANFSTKKKLFGLVFIPIIYLVNIIRVWFMFWFVKAYDLAYFSIVHTLIWSWGLIIVILVLWILWMKYVRL
jgi:exosortase/archaeosortase family protein